MRDLRRLLELYQRWQRRLIGGLEFNAFEAAAERLSGTNALKARSGARTRARRPQQGLRPRRPLSCVRG